MALKSRRGYTLTEVLLVVAIVGLVSSMAATLMVNMTNFWRQSSARTAIQQDVRVSLDIIDRFARQAQASTICIDQVAGQPPFSRLSFTTIQGWNVSFYQNGKNLIMTNSEEGNNTSVLSKNLAYIAFSFPHSDTTSLISVAMTTQAATYKGGRKALQLSIQNVRVMN
jgi:prepilin-type N-terminal cleavage/methylation domain-containing protein